MGTPAHATSIIVDADDAQSTKRSRANLRRLGRKCAGRAKDSTPLPVNSYGGIVKWRGKRAGCSWNFTAG